MHAIHNDKKHAKSTYVMIPLAQNSSGSLYVFVHTIGILTIGTYGMETGIARTGEFYFLLNSDPYLKFF